MLDNQFDHKHYRFPREHTGDAPRRTAPPLDDWRVVLLEFLCGVAIAALIIVIEKVW